MVRAHGIADRRAIEQRKTSRRKRGIPARSILVGQGIQVPGRIDACRQPRGVEAHERCEGAGRGRRSKWVLGKRKGEAERLPAQLGAYGGLRGRAMIALVEE